MAIEKVSIFSANASQWSKPVVENAISSLREEHSELESQIQAAIQAYAANFNSPKPSILN